MHCRQQSHDTIGMNYTYDDEGAVDTTTLVHPTWSQYGEKYKADFGAPVTVSYLMLTTSFMRSLRAGKTARYLHFLL